MRKGRAGQNDFFPFNFSFMEHIRSMTGFGRAYTKTEAYRLAITIRSVNSKGLDIGIRAPKELAIYEKEIRNRIKAKVYRGQILVNINVETFKVKPALKLEELADVVEEILSSTRKLGLSISDDLVLNLAMRFYNPTEESKESLYESEEFKELLFGTFGAAFIDFMKSKYEEGKNLEEDIRNNLKELETLLEEVKKKTPELIEASKQRLLEKAKNLLKDILQSKTVVQELKFLLERVDINEEIQRLESHIKLFNEELEKGAPIGRKLEFITQEMLREVNTMGNKLPNLFPLNIEMKTAIDKIRQQVANIE
jgi:uncharacterized protein (TIGR00255 family)